LRLKENNMTNTYNACRHLNKLKDQSDKIQTILFQYKYKDYVKINNKLANCSYSSIVNNNRIDQQNQSCGSPLCPICDSAHKIRKQCGIACAVMDKINEGIILDNGRKLTPTMQLLTLTVPKVPVYEFDDALKQIKTDFKTFLSTKMQKQSGKLVTINQCLLGSSTYYHLSLSDTRSGNPLIGVHLHAILLLQPSFLGVNAITKDMVRDYWMIVTGHRDLLQTHMKKIPLTHSNFIRATAYGLAKLDFDEAIANPRKYIQLLSCLHGKHFVQHTGMMKSFRKEVREEYKVNQQIAHNAQMQIEIAKRIDAYDVIIAI